MFLLIDLHLPFSDFKVGILNHMTIAFSRLHPKRRAYVKVFQYLCKYKKSVPTLTFFFHLFKVQRSPTDSTWGQSMIYLNNNSKMFEVYFDSVKKFNNQYYLVIYPLTEMAHPNICNIEFKSHFRCSDKFSKF